LIARTNKYANAVDATSGRARASQSEANGANQQTVDWRKSRTAGPHRAGTGSRQPAAPSAWEPPKWLRRESEAPHPSANPAVAEGEGSRLSTTKPADGNLAPYRPPSQGRKTFLRNHADNGRFSPSVMNSLAFISVVLWLPTGFADGGGNARTILRALDQLASSRPFGPKSRIKSGHGRPLSPINCSDMVSISNCPRQVNSSPSNWKDSSILPSQKCSTR